MMASTSRNKNKNKFPAVPSKPVLKLLPLFPLLLLLAAAAFVAFELGYAVAPSTRETRFFAPAIDDAGKGVLIEFVLSSRAGNGKLLVNIGNAQYQEDTEKSFALAREQAEKILGISLGARDFVLDVGFGGKQGGVAGESAGAAFASAIVANALGKEVRGDAIVSAALSQEGEGSAGGEGGELQPIGGVEEKILAAAAGGKKFFVVASGQEIKYEPELSQKIKIVRARTLRDALPYLIA